MFRKRLDCYIDIVRSILMLCILVVIFFACKGRKLHQNEVATQIPKDALKYIFFKKKPKINLNSAESILKFINLVNQRYIILNEEIYGPIEKDTVTIVVNVHKISIYLEFLLVSLSQIRGIDKTFIIFSHSYYDENMNELIRSIDFARVMQIYYPYSLQVYPNKFPGFHPGDCPHSMSLQEAEALNCTGALYPDIHGRYRNPKLSEKKLHWWWTANIVFEMLSKSFDNYTAPVIFLNDDVYLLQDFMYMILYIKQVAEFLPRFDFISLDAMSDCNNFNGYRVDIKKWVPMKSADVLAFDLSTWNSIVPLSHLFCAIDDYSWSRSLYYVSMNRINGLPYNVISTSMARAFKTSSCGFEAKLVDCDAIESIYQVLNLQNKMKDDLAPSYLDAYTLVELIDEFESIDYAESNGGWNDPRDKELCKNFTRIPDKTSAVDERWVTKRLHYFSEDI